MAFRRWLCASLLVAPLCAQRPATAVQVHDLGTIDAKAVLGLPSSASRLSGLCSRDGLTFFAGSADAASRGDLYSVSSSAEVRHIVQKMPLDYTDVSARSFFPSEHTLVTLLEATNHDEAGNLRGAPQYFLSLSDPTGGQSDLLALALNFKPFRVGAFGSGDFLVLGRDTANQLPVLARLKADGTVRRILDLTTLQKGAALGDLSAAALVPFGDDILLTFPGTTKPAWLMRDVGEDRLWPLQLPAGAVLHDVLGSDGGYSVVYRVQPATGDTAEKPAQTPPPLRLFEVNVIPVELKLGTVPIASATCAARHAVTAVWMQGVKAKTADASAKPADELPQLVIGTVPR